MCTTRSCWSPWSTVSSRSADPPASPAAQAPGQVARGRWGRSVRHFAANHCTIRRRHPAARRDNRPLRHSRALGVRRFRLLAAFAMEARDRRLAVELHFEGVAPVTLA
jgi:hypothetical protein